MTVSEIREAAARLLEQGWTQGYFAKDADGEACSGADPRAVCFCMAGALMRLAKQGDASRAYCEVKRELGVQVLSDYNDAPGRTQSEVVAAMRGRQP